MKADSGAAKTYLKPAHMTYLKKVTTLLDPNKIYFPDNTVLTPTHAGELDLHPSLPNKPQQASIGPGLSNPSLISIGQAYNEGCYVLFSSTHLHIIRDGKILITGYRNKTDGLWDVPFKNKTNEEHIYARQAINIIVNKTQSKTNLAKYLHGCAFSTIISTFKTAIGKGNFVTWPGIDSLNFEKLVGTARATIKGHLDQERQGLQSTKPQINLEYAHEDAFPQQSLPKTREIGITITELKNTKYSDLTGKLPHVLSRGTNISSQYTTTILTQYLSVL